MISKTYSFDSFLQFGETFVNKVYSVEGINEDEVYTNGNIRVQCRSNGTIYPDFFNQTYNWCRR